MKNLFKFLFMTLMLSSTSFAGTFMAGSSKVDITPSIDSFPYIGHVNFSGVHDHIYARALVVSDGNNTAAFVVLDEGKVPEPENTIRMISEASGIPEKNIMLSVTHTHSTLLSNLFGIPNDVMKNQILNIQKGAIDAIKDAKKNMQKANISYSHSLAYVNTNNGELNKNENEYDPLGVSDKSLDIVKISSDSGENIALLINYASHAEVMFKSITKDGMSEITGDLPGATAKYLEESPKGAPVVLYTAGAEGDQLPLFKSVQTSKELGTIDEENGGWTLLDVQARRLATTVLNALGTMPKGLKNVSINAVSKNISIPGQKVNMDRTTGKVDITDTPNIEVPIIVIKIGDIAFAGVGADIASSIGINIKKAFPIKDTMLITNLAGSIGYILDDKAYINPSHGVLGSPVKPGFAENIISTEINKILIKN